MVDVMLLSSRCGIMAITQANTSGNTGSEILLKDAGLFSISTKTYERARCGGTGQACGAGIMWVLGRRLGADTSAWLRRIHL